ncbi:hypothetical protein ACLOJK_034500 [Asimina triloba]
MVPLAMDTLLIPDSIGAAHFVLASSMEMGSLLVRFGIHGWIVLGFRDGIGHAQIRFARQTLFVVAEFAVCCRMKWVNGRPELLMMVVYLVNPMDRWVL